MSIASDLDELEVMLSEMEKRANALQLRASDLRVAIGHPADGAESPAKVASLYAPPRRNNGGSEEQSA